MTDVLELTKELINRRSVTPEDAGCQDFMKAWLAESGFENETMVFEDTTNLWSRRGSDGPVFCFAGRTDVVPSGPEDAWQTPPFVATEKDGNLHGRGAAEKRYELPRMLCAFCFKTSLCWESTSTVRSWTVATSLARRVGSRR